MDGVLIKLLSGAQAGAELLLPSGTYVVGSADDADLVLSDVAVLPRHATLTVNGAEWAVEPVDDAEVRVDGTAISGSRTIRPYQVVTFGGVHAALGPEGPWAALPAIPAANAVSIPPPDGAGAATPAPGPAAPPAGMPKRSGANAGVRIVKATLAVLAPLAVLALAGVAFWALTRPTRAEALAQALGQRGITAVASAAGAHGTAIPVGVVAVSEEEGRLRLSGLLPTEAERRAVLAAAAGSGTADIHGLRTVAEAVDEAWAPLAERFPGLDAELDEDRPAAVLVGLAGDAAEGARAYRQLRDRLDARVFLRRGWLAWPDVRREAARALERAGGPAGVRFDREGGKLLARNAHRIDPEIRRIFLERLADRAGVRAAALFSAALALETEPAESAAATQRILSAEPPPPEPDPDLAEALAGKPDHAVATTDTAPPPVATAATETPQIESIPATPEPEAPPAPTERVWRVAEVTPAGFVDQDGAVHPVGEELSRGLRFLRVWSKGVVFQRNGETLVLERGAMIAEEK